METNFKSYNGCELNFFFKALLEIKGKILQFLRQKNSHSAVRRTQLSIALGEIVFRVWETSLHSYLFYLKPVLEASAAASTFLLTAVS